MKLLTLRPRTALVRAFTIIEVLVATLVLSMILVSLYATWQIILRSTDHAVRLTVDAQRARMSMRVVEEALGAAQLFQSNPGLYSFIADTSGNFSAVSLCANLPESFPGGGYFGGERLRRISFTVESGDDGPELRLFQNSALAPADAEGSPPPLVLARNVSAFQLEFWDPRSGEFQPDWRWTNQLPRLVRVTLGFGTTGRGQGRPAELVTRTVLISSQTVPPPAGGPAPGNPR
jgi:type II secretory pathway pseudopilin PulG